MKANSNDIINSDNSSDFSNSDSDSNDSLPSLEEFNEYNYRRPSTLLNDVADGLSVEQKILLADPDYLAENYIDLLLDIYPMWAVHDILRNYLFFTLSLEEITMFYYHNFTEERVRNMMLLSIIASVNEENHGNSPIKVLKALKCKGAKFDSTLYQLVQNNSSISVYQRCKILRLFCDTPATTIQRTWRTYRQKKAAKLIQQKALEWLYRPGGPFMMRAKTSYYATAMVQ
jgi:hypothetical protein